MPLIMQFWRYLRDNHSHLCESWPNECISRYPQSVDNWQTLWNLLWNILIKSFTDHTRPDQIRPCSIGCESITFQRTPGNLTLDSASRLALCLDPRWVMILFIHRLRNYLSVRRRSIFRNGNAYNPGKNDDSHNGMEISQLSRIQHHSKIQAFDKSDNIKHILQPIIEFCLESGWRHFVIHADNARPHAVWKS
jgi:hypothetical protein